MPNDRSSAPPVTPAIDPGGSPSPGPAGAAASSHPTAVTWALADGLGVYTASSGTPFLTAPPASNGATAPGRDPVAPADVSEDELEYFREPLRREVEGVAVGSRLSEDEVSGLVSAVLSFIARHFSIGRDSTRRVETRFGRPQR